VIAMYDCVEVVPNLFIGGESLIPIPPTGFDVVVSCREVPDLHVPSLKEILTQGGPMLLSVPMIDAPIEVAYRELICVGEYVCRCLDSAYKVLVHCKQGLNRSGLVVGTVLFMRGYTADDAIAMIRSKRPGALTNETFVKQLRSL